MMATNMIFTYEHRVPLLLQFCSKGKYACGDCVVIFNEYERYSLFSKFRRVSLTTGLIKNKGIRKGILPEEASLNSGNQVFKNNF